jgi:hypothetical protein
MRNAFVATLKVTANTMMAMLFMVLTSCSGEAIGDHHPSSASNLIGTMDESNGIGWAQVDVEANATDADNNNLNASASVRYEGEKEVMVENEEELGLPVILTLTGENTIATGDKNVITRTESHKASKGVTLNVAGPDLSKGGYLGERTENGDTIRQEVLANLIDEAFATAASLPEGKIKEWRDSKTSVVKYYRVFVKKAAPEEPIVYRKTLTIDWSDTKGSAYADMLTEKVQGNTVLEKAAHYDIVAAWGQYKPEVKTINVTGTSFRNEDIQGVNALNATSDGDVTGLGDDGKYTRRCVRHTTETYSDVFTSTPDADGNTDRPIRCNLDTWLYEYTCELSDGHTETFSVEFEIKSIKNEVDPTTNIYERIIEVRINGQLADTMNGKVQLVF